MTPATSPSARFLDAHIPPTLRVSTTRSLGGLGMLCPTCSSPNVQKLDLFWKSLPAESPLRATYAPPDEVASQVLIALVATVVGIGVAVSGAILLGLLIAVGGMVFGVVNHAGVERYRGQLADWAASRLCLACNGLF